MSRDFRPTSIIGFRVFSALRNGSRGLSALQRILQPFRKRKAYEFVDWGQLLERESSAWQQARANATGPRVLIGITVGGPFRVWNNVEAMLGVALTLRG